MTRKILIALDGSNNSELAYKYYLDNIRKDGDSLVIAHVVEPPPLPTFSLKSGFNLPSDDWRDIIMENGKRAKALEEDVSIRASQTHIKMDFVAESGKRPGEVLVDIANRTGCQHIVIGTRGLSEIKRAFMGSVSDYVLHHSGIPTTVVPNNK